MSLLDHIAYDLIIDEVAPHSKVLDLGCGDGILLQRLQELKEAVPYGVEISEDGVCQCVEKGLYCYQGDIDEGLADYKDNSFDYVILNQTLQITKRPSYVLNEMMRISKNAIVSFPNFGYYKTRLQLLLKGIMPKNMLLPYEWYETPNIHLLTIRDFQIFCIMHGYPIKKENHFSVTTSVTSHRVGAFPNLCAQYGFFVLDGERYTRPNTQ
ncbi:MAG: methionine biosynthesis protein MetW [Spirochaetes bacterium]|nr:methionine biosynthesis protein MetW [Spirochaetota bacterium]